MFSHSFATLILKAHFSLLFPHLFQVLFHCSFSFLIIRYYSQSSHIPLQHCFSKRFSLIFSSTSSIISFFFYFFLILLNVLTFLCKIVSQSIFPSFFSICFDYFLVSSLKRSIIFMNVLTFLCKKILKAYFSFFLFHLFRELFPCYFILLSFLIIIILNFPLQHCFTKRFSLVFSCASRKISFFSIYFSHSLSE
uniref:Uncharacterized protein n=1 Tax=Cacopsylla melanoneura TaxID=428564 RepID=A0A8D8ZAK7_9HEMI